MAMRKILIFLLCLLFPLTAWGVTFEWDHNCENTTGFRIYHDDKVVVETLCPNTTASVETAIDGSYFARAYNEHGSSDLSNELLLAGYYYNSIKYDYDTSPFQRLIYRGENTRHDAGEADVDWVVTKYYYDTNGLMTGMRIRTTSWTNRSVGW